MDDEPLLPEIVAAPPPVRRGSSAYRVAIAGGYNGHQLWALAPIDPMVRERYHADPMRSDFVWLLIDGEPVWALVDTAERRIIVLDPVPMDRALKEEPYWRARRRRRRSRLRRLWAERAKG